MGGPKKTVGFLGFGRIAQVTLTRLVGFGITECVYTTRVGSPPKTELEDTLTEKHRSVNPAFGGVRQVDLKTLARESDVLFVLAPGGAETRHIVNEDFLKEMKRTSVLVNTSRGSLVDSVALAKALREGWIWGAGLDVVEGEPDIAADHPLVKEPRRVNNPASQVSCLTGACQLCHCASHWKRNVRDQNRYGEYDYRQRSGCFVKRAYGFGKENLTRLDRDTY